MGTNLESCFPRSIVCACYSPIIAAPRPAYTARPPLIYMPWISCGTSVMVPVNSRPIHAAPPTFSTAPGMSRGAFLHMVCCHPGRVALAHSPHPDISYCSCALLLYTHDFSPFTFVHPQMYYCISSNHFLLIRIWAYKGELRGQYIVEEGRYCAMGSIIICWELAHL